MSDVFNCYNTNDIVTSQKYAKKIIYDKAVHFLFIIFCKIISRTSSLMIM